MNRALWKKSFREARWLLLGCVVLMFGFHWLRVWLASQIPLGRMQMILRLMPSHWERLSPVPWTELATSAGRIAMIYDEPLVLMIITVWSIGRGSDAVAGELGRGTMEMLLTQPISRLSVLFSQACVTVLGAALIAVSAWLGTAAGLATITLEEVVPAKLLLGPALNLFSLAFFLAGLSTLVSSLDRYRSRVIGLVGAFYAIEVVVKVVGRLAPGGGWLAYLSCFSAFEPQRLVKADRAWSFWLETNDSFELGGLGYLSVLAALAIACYAAAAVIFVRRDLPAPL